jgi:LacI family transcriptional regulator
MSIVSVAKRAGVSVATVSRVLNDLDNVRAETAEQVRTAMQEIGYTPPRIRRGPKGARRRPAPSGMRTGQIAVLTLGGLQNWLQLPVMASVVAGITRAAKEMEARAVLDEMPNPQMVSPILRRREVDGAVVFCMSGVPVKQLVRLQEYVPVVWAMGNEDALAGVDHVSPDNSGIGRLAYEYLAALGCRRFAFITDHPEWLFARVRAQAFANAARDAGHTVLNYLAGTTTTLEREAYGGKTCARPALDRLVRELVAEIKKRSLGLFVPTDLLLTMVYPLLARHGIEPERDLRIISCDNENERLSLLNPRPASIDIRSEEIGRLAARQLVQRIQRPDEPAVRIQIAPQVVLPPTPLAH